MNIDFHSPQGEVHSWILKYVRDQLIELHHLDKNISRAAVIFRDQEIEPGMDKVCDISLAILNESFFVSRNASSFEKASRSATHALKEVVIEHLKLQNEPPDLITSTVKV